MKNCRMCIHFVRRTHFVYDNYGTVKTIKNVIKCDKMNIPIELKRSEEKSNEDVFIPNKCKNARHFKKLPDINIHDIVLRDL